jgi:glycosyltransferase involved in cell wall biosynthesis
MGSVRHIMEVSENLCRLGHRVHLVVPGYARYHHETPVKILYVPLLNLRFLRTIMFELLSPVFVIAQFIFWRPAIVYWRQALLTIFPVLLSRIFGRDIITEVNGLTMDELESEPLPEMRKRFILACEWFNYRFSTHLICVAPQIRSRILSRYRLPGKKVSVILNGVNAERMPLLEPADAKKQIGLDPCCPVIGFVGHLFPWDGVEFLIAAAPQVIAEFPDVKFMIVGHGQWGTHLADLAVQHGVSGQFVFTGKVQWERLYIYVNAFDIATAPYAMAINTQSGRSSLKILEYFACKKPVVATETTAIPEIVDLHEKGLGITVAAENKDALAHALIELLGDAPRRAAMGSNGRAYVLGERSWTIVARRIDALMKTLLE